LILTSQPHLSLSSVVCVTASPEIANLDGKDGARKEFVPGTLIALGPLLCSSSFMPSSVQCAGSESYVWVLRADS
jgi:hypothetical protein